MWIGLRRMRIDDKIHFRWNDGSSFDYTPSGYRRSDGGNAFAAIDANTWRRRTSHDIVHAYPFACRRPHGEISFSTCLAHLLWMFNPISRHTTHKHTTMQEMNVAVSRTQ